MDTWERLIRRTKTARDRVAAEVPADDHGFRAARNIRELEKLRAFVDELIDDELIRGREQGASWGMLGRSKQQAQQRHKRAVQARAILFSRHGRAAAKKAAKQSTAVDE